MPNEAWWGLIATPDPVQAARKILNAVTSERLIPNFEIFDCYAALKSYRTILTAPPNQEAGKALRIDSAAVRESEARAGNKLLHAQMATISPQDPRSIDALWPVLQEMEVEKFLGYPVTDGEKMRAAILKYQLELPPDVVRGLFDSGYVLKDPDFLPLIQKEIQWNPPNLKALLALAIVRPEEARPYHQGPVFEGPSASCYPVSSLRASNDSRERRRARCFFLPFCRRQYPSNGCTHASASV